MSRQFAFAQFAALEDARAFLDRYFPSIQLYGAYDTAKSRETAAAVVRISYSREKEDRDRAGTKEDDWKCDIV
jgi:RNA-binding protein 5/10